MTRHVLLAGCVLALGVVGCGPTAPPAQPEQPPPDDPGPPANRVTEAFGFHFADWPSVTTEPHQVSAALYLFCRAPTAEETERSEADEKKEHGPHAQSAIVVRVNPTGLERFKAGQSVPVGTVVIKEKYPRYTSDKPPAAVAAMMKHEPGYDPDHGDWEYAYEQLSPEKDRTVTRGKLDSCIDCHTNAKEKDYLFRPYLQAKR